MVATFSGSLTSLGLIFLTPFFTLGLSQRMNVSMASSNTALVIKFIGGTLDDR